MCWGYGCWGSGVLGYGHLDHVRSCPWRRFGIDSAPRAAEQLGIGALVVLPAATVAAIGGATGHGRRRCVSCGKLSRTPLSDCRGKPYDLEVEKKSWQSSPGTTWCPFGRRSPPSNAERSLLFTTLFVVRWTPSSMRLKSSWSVVGSYSTTLCASASDSGPNGIGKVGDVLRPMPRHSRHCARVLVLSVVGHCGSSVESFSGVTVPKRWLSCIVISTCMAASFTPMIRLRVWPMPCDMRSRLVPRIASKEVCMQRPNVWTQPPAWAGCHRHSRRLCPIPAATRSRALGSTANRRPIRPIPISFPTLSAATVVPAQSSYCHVPIRPRPSWARVRR